MLGGHVIAAFEACGYRLMPAVDDDIALLEKRVDGAPCHCNDRCVVHALVHRPFLELPPTVSIETVGEYAPKRWVRISAYTIRWADVTEALIDKVEGDVVRAWNAMHGKG